jgi:hypothetical protein
MLAVSVNTSSPWFKTVCFATIYSKASFLNKKAKNIKNYKKFKKCANVNTGYDVKKQHSQSGMRWPEIIGD